MYCVYIYTHTFTYTNIKWLLMLVPDDIASLAFLHLWQHIQPVDAPSWSRRQLRSAGTSAAPPSWDFSILYEVSWGLNHQMYSISNISECKTV